MKEWFWFSVKVFICLFFVAFAVYHYVDLNNRLTKYRLQVPLLEKEIAKIKRENVELQYEIELFESPIHLLEIAEKEDFRHLVYPYNDQIVQLPEERMEEAGAQKNG